MFKESALKISELLEKKNKAYGDWDVTEKILALLYPEGLKVSQFAQAGAVIRVIDKLRRISHGNLKDSWEDIMGYALLMVESDSEHRPTLKVCPSCNLVIEEEADFAVDQIERAIHLRCVVDLSKKKLPICVGCKKEIPENKITHRTDTGGLLCSGCSIPEGTTILCENCGQTASPMDLLCVNNRVWCHEKCPKPNPHDEVYNGKKR